MTVRPWSPAEIAGAKALLEAVGYQEPFENLTVRSQEYRLLQTRAVLDAAGAGLRAEVAAELDALATQVRGEPDRAKPVTTYLDTDCGWCDGVGKSGRWACECCDGTGKERDPTRREIGDPR